MSCACLGDEIDIHGGGLDLVFPHHENEIAQSECSTGKPFARYWMHNGLLTMTGGQKMGKSLNNVINISDALLDFPAETIRFYLLQNHYRSPLPWSGTALNEALSMVARLYEAKESASLMGGQEPPQQVVAALGSDAQAVWTLGNDFLTKMHKALDEDFNTAQTLGIAFELARAINRFSAHKKARKRGGPVVAPALAGFSAVASALGLLGDDPMQFQEEVKSKRLSAMGLDLAVIEDAIQRRASARSKKDWPTSDAIRKEMSDRGILLMDTGEGMTWRVRL